MASSTSLPGTRLPVPLNRLIGREYELDLLHTLLVSGARLITLVGPGGVGKTRLALEACAREADSYTDGAAFVTLEVITDGDDVLPEIARALSVELSGTGAPLNDLVAALARKRQLLCVDNWEHLIEAGAQMIPLLERCPGLQMLATSREPLRLRGEQLVAVEPLRLPTRSVANQFESAVEASAIQLFVERARAVRPGFELDWRNTAIVLEICSLVDGLPLAIELAASLLRLFSPETLLVRMKTSPVFAGQAGAIGRQAGGLRDLPSRQQTLRSTIEWSYALLDVQEQSVLRRMAVFEGGCDLEAVGTVCGVDGIGERPPMDILIALVDKSLVRVQDTSGELRFSMLRTIQEFALEKLHGCTEFILTQERHAIFYHDLAARLGAETRGSNRAQAIDFLVRDYDNFRRALRFSVEQQAKTVAMDLCRHLSSVWLYSGLLVEGRRWIDRTLALPGSADASSEAAVLYRASVLALHQGQNEIAHRYLLRCIALRRESANTEELARALIYLGVVELCQNADVETVLAHIQEGIELSRIIDSPAIIVFGLEKAGAALLSYQQYESAIDYAEQSLELLSRFPELAVPQHYAEVFATLGISNASLGNYERAEEFLQKAISASDQDDWVVDRLVTYSELGKLAVHRKRFQDAERYLFDSLEKTENVQSEFAVIDLLESVACLAQAQSVSELAAQLWGACEGARARLALPRTPHEQATIEPYLLSSRIELGEKTFLAAYQKGEAMKLDEAVRIAQDSYPKEANKQSPKPAKATNPAGLTAREVEVLRLVAEGLSDKEIAERLVLSPRTVNAHLTSVYSKLGVNSRVAAARWAIENGLSS